jgi:hypothetical protein
MTVAEQRAQEVDALTKNELAAQRGDTAQKQVGDQQAMMQKMMGGVASAPGAAMAAQPKMFASGGIVGYAGPEGSVVGKKPLDEQAQAELQEAQRTGDRNAMMMTIKKLAAAGYDVATLIPRGVMGAAESAVRGVADSRLGRALGLDAIPKLPESAYGGDRTSITPMMDRVKREEQAATQPAPPARPASVSEAQATAAAGPQAAVPPAAKLPPANVVAAAQGGPKPPAPTGGLPTLPGAAGAPPQVQPGVVGPANDFGKKLEAAALKNAEIDPAARQLSEEERITNKMALTPDQRKVYDEGIAGLQGMYKEQYDPERQQREGLKRALIGAGGRRYGEFAGAATAGMAYDDQQRAAKLKEFGDVQKARTGLVDIDRANVKGGIDAGMKAYEQGSLSQRQGLESGSRMYGDDVKSRDTLYNIDVGSRDKALDRVVEKLKVDAQNAATKANRENLSFERARTLYGTLTQRVQKAEIELQENFDKGPMGMLAGQDLAKLKPEDRNRLDIAKLELKRQKETMRKELAPVLESAAKQMGISNTDLSAEDRAVIEKYTKGK